MDTISDRVRQIIAEKVKLPATSLAGELRFMEDLKATSLDTIEITMAVEDEFDVEIADADADKLTTVGSLIEYIKAKQTA